MNIHIFDNIIDTFAYYDRPVLFISKMHDQKYICVLVSDDNPKEKWLISNILDETYDDLKKGKIDFYNCFKQTKFGKSFLLSIVNEHTENSEEIISSEIPDSILPTKGIHCRIPIKTNNTKFLYPHP